jgi:hypothetical protein
MAENNSPQAQPETQQAQPTSTATEKTGGERMLTQAEVEQIVKDRLGREAEKRKAGEAEAARKAAETAAQQNGEWEKLAKQREAELAQLQASLKQRDLADKKRSIAEKVGLPPALAARLIGDTDEEIEKDAKALFETLPKPAASKQAGLQPMNPGANGSQQETAEQKRLRLFGPTSDVFTGGGVVWNNKE